MRTATGESGSDIDQIRELEERLDNFRIQVAEDMTIRGSAWQGYALNSKTCEEMGFGGGGGGPGMPGACCLPDGTCETVTPGQCLLDGGTFYGGDCDPNPCSPTATGACCVGTDCSIETNSDCTDMGGTYQGDDTVCDPNPCELPICPCYFTDANLPGRYFMRRDRNGFLNLSEAICFDGSAETNDSTFTGAYEEYDSDCNFTSVDGNRHVVHRLCNGTVITSDLPYNFSTSLGCGSCAVTSSVTTVSGTTVTVTCHSDNTSGDDCHQVGEDNFVYSQECTPA